MRTCRRCGADISYMVAQARRCRLCADSDREAASRVRSHRRYARVTRQLDVPACPDCTISLRGWVVRCAGCRETHEVEDAAKVERLLVLIAARRRQARTRLTDSDAWGQAGVSSIYTQGAS